jgi:hypothetical protein
VKPLDISDFCTHCRKEIRKMKVKEITYLIPRKYLKESLPGSKPIAVRAWETPVPGLIVQRPIAGTRLGEVHLTHKASGAILVFNVKGLKTAVAMARALKGLPVRFTAADPAALYRAFSKFTDRQVEKFRKATRMKGDVSPDRWRNYAAACAENFDAVARAWKGNPAKRRRPAARKRGGKAWKAKNKR